MPQKLLKFSKFLKTEKSNQHKKFYNIKTSSKHVVCSFENLLSFWAKSLTFFWSIAENFKKNG